MAAQAERAYPFAYGLRDHIVFREPFKIGTTGLVERFTSKAFRNEITNAKVSMLPLVSDQTKQWRPGWCTYPDGFDENPDIEVFCGGENSKMAGAAACWRQGNLLHFGFEQSPAEMNEAGQRLLLNCVAYISRFTEDRPIAGTPSVFAGPVGLPRAYLDRRLAKTGSGNVSETATMLKPTLFQELKSKSLDEAKQWYAKHRSFLHPSGDEMKLELDEDALALKAPIDRVEFFDRIIQALSSNEKVVAKGLLARYAPAGTESNDSAEFWQQWIKENRAYLFFSDQGDYRWYIDPLAKKRGIPCKDLHGPARASR